MKYVLVFLFGFLLALTPDLIGILDDEISDGYQQIGCKGIHPDKCEFDQNDWYQKYKNDYPNLVEASYYFQLGESGLYYALTGRCSLQTFHNPSADPKGTGKRTLRSYFGTRCSTFAIELSDLIYGGE